MGGISPILQNPPVHVIIGLYNPKIIQEAFFMYLVDYHTHSLCSQDSDAPLADMAQAAAEAGLFPVPSPTCPVNGV